MKNILLIFLTCLLSVVSCACTSLTGPSGQLLWQSSISDGKLIEGELATFFYLGQITALGNQFSNGKPTVYSFDAQTGSLQWKWADWFLDNGFILTDIVYAHSNVMIVSNAALNYGINLSSGQTVWRNRVHGSQGGSQGANGIGSLYFFGAYMTTGAGQLFVGNMNTGKEEVLIKFPNATGPVLFTPFVASNQDTMLIVTSVYGEAATNFYNKTYLTLFNVTQNKEIYTLLQREGPSTENNLPMGVPVVQGDRVFTTIGFGVQCNEIATGKLLWRTTTPRPFTEGGVIWGDGILFANDDDGFLQSFEPATGKVLWKTKTAGSVTGLFFMNGVVYLVGGDGNLYAIDGKQGTIIWKMRSPDDDGRSGSFFTGKVVGANGKIYARSFLNLYCYKAAR